MSTVTQKRRTETRKPISLKRQLLALTILISIIITAAWVIQMTVLVHQYQNEQDRNRMADLEAYAQVLDNSINQLNEVVGNIYMTNPKFEEMNRCRSAAQEVDVFYELMNLLRIQVNSNHKLSGLFVYYDSMEKFFYFMQDSISFEEKEDLKKSGLAMGQSENLRSGINTGMNYISEAGEKPFYNVFLKKTKAAIAGCVCLEEGLPIEREKGAAYGVLYKGKLYTTCGEKCTLQDEEISRLLPGKTRLDGKQIWVHPLETTDLAVVEILNESLWLYVQPRHLLLLGLCLVFVFLSVMLNRIVNLQVIRPLEDMDQALSRIQAGIWEVQFNKENRVEEIENVRNAVQILLKEIETYKIRSYEEKLEKQEAELQYLQLQLAPHFYTNCLKNAYYMLMLKEYDHVEQYLLCLSTHLRYLLQKNVKVIELQRECEFVSNYIELQRLMTEKPLTLSMQVDEGTEKIQVPILLLQTFVENSVKYGRQTEQTDLHLMIRVRIREMENGRFLDVHLKDNGPGYPEAVLEELNHSEISQEQKYGVGIINLQHRMRLRYGEQVGWYFSNMGGACADLLLPIGGDEE